MTPPARPRRSAIYLPASSARALEKVRSLPCDVVILDLEDMVGADAKAEARSAAVDAVRRGSFGSREVVIRTNGLGTPWGEDDLAAAAQARPDAVLVPKISAPGDLAAARMVLGDVVPIWAMIETGAAVMRLNEIGAASAAKGVAAWVVGSNDLAKDIRCAHTVARPGLVTALSMIVMAARAHGLAVLDGIFNDLADPAGLANQCGQALALGFDGKTVIHPGQLEIANKAFTPEEAAVIRAQAVVAAFDAPEHEGRAGLKVEGQFVERLHYDEAKRLIRIADKIRAIGY
ncbi:HpcH/HpaI aldolase/citrate lyase family protein [Cupriavidus sp. CP313]